MGYQRERIFIPNQGTGQGAPKTYTRRPSSNRNTKRSKDSDDGEAKLSAKRKENIETRLTSPIRWHDSIAKTIPPYLEYRQQLLSNFLNSFKLLSDSSVQRSGTSRDKPGAWLCRLPDLATSTRALELSILALSAAKLGRLNNDPMLVRESLRSYVLGLSELQKALRDSTLMV